MSNIYILEPPSVGKVLLRTTVGDIDIELWSKEAPKACRNFVQLCMEGYYNNTIFHRVVKEFIVQGGDPTGTGTGGESIYGQPFKDEFHTRLRFARRGLVAMANAGKDDNGSQFFFTLAACPELQNKHTIFGKVTGETLFNMLKLEEGIIEDDERPAYPQKIIKTEILSNPFPDIIPRVTAESIKPTEKKKTKKSGVKNFKLLSFGDEAEEDEEETIEINRNFVGKSKSTHDLLDDPKLSAVPAVEKNNDSSDESSLSGDEHVKSSNEKVKNNLDLIKGKLKKKQVDENEDEEGEYYLGKEKDELNKKKMEEIKREIKQLKKNYQKDKKEKSPEPKEKLKKEADETIKQYMDEQKKYKEIKEKIPKKGTSREAFTMALLEKFKAKLNSAKEKFDETKEKAGNEVRETDEVQSDDWLAHKLQFENETPVLAKDASTKDDNWFDITDPRNAINKRRREESKDIMSKKEKRTF